MKKILVPVDFSEVSKNALNYAVELADANEASITLIHVYLPPGLVNDSMEMLDTPERIERESMLKMNKIRETIETKYQHLKVSCYCTSGVTRDEINRHAKEHNMNLIVLGTQGAGYLEEKILGSTAASLIRMASCPVMAIDKKVHFNVPRKILLATDFVQLETTTILKPLKELVTLFSSELCILNIIEKNTINPSSSEIAAGFELDHTFKQFHHTFFYAKNEEVVDGINEFTEQHNIDMVVMIPHHHSIISRLFKEPITHKMAYQSKVPLLTLH